MVVSSRIVSTIKLTYLKNLRSRIDRSRDRQYIIRPKEEKTSAKKPSILVFLDHCFLKFGNTHLVCESLTIRPSRLYTLSSRLRVSTRQQILERSSVATEDLVLIPYR